MDSFALLVLVICFGISYPSCIPDSAEDNGSLSSETHDDTCDAGILLPNTTLAVHISKDTDGHWDTNFYAHNMVGSQPRSLDLRLKKKVIGCGDTEYLVLSGYLKDTDPEDSPVLSEEEMVFNLDEQKEGDKLRIRSLEDRQASVENALKSVEETMNKMKNILVNMPRHVYYTRFDDSIKGKYIKLYNNLRTAKRTKPQEGYGFFGGVISRYPLEDDEIFRFRIDETMNIWKEYGIAFGVMNQKGDDLKGERILISRQGALSICSGKDSATGKANIFRDGKQIGMNAYPLDTRHLPVGTVLGISRRANGGLHFYINGDDKGAAFAGVPDGVYAFVDLIQYVTKISIKH